MVYDFKLEYILVTFNLCECERGGKRMGESDIEKRMTYDQLLVTLS